ncbi:hypothetical protein QTP88_021581 [Uroleucon formosanum]
MTVIGLMHDEFKIHARIQRLKSFSELRTLAHVLDGSKSVMSDNVGVSTSVPPKLKWLDKRKSESAEKSQVPNPKQRLSLGEGCRMCGSHEHWKSACPKRKSESGNAKTTGGTAWSRLARKTDPKKRNFEALRTGYSGKSPNNMGQCTGSGKSLRIENVPDKSENLTEVSYLSNKNELLIWLVTAEDFSKTFLLYPQEKCKRKDSNTDSKFELRKRFSALRTGVLESLSIATRYWTPKRRGYTSNRGWQRSLAGVSPKNRRLSGWPTVGPENLRKNGPELSGTDRNPSVEIEDSPVEPDDAPVIGRGYPVVSSPKAPSTHIPQNPRGKAIWQ